MTMASIMGSAAGLGVEAGASRREDTGLRRRDLLAGQGTVFGLEQQAEGETLAALSNLGATIFVVQFHAAQDSASCLSDYQHRVAGKRQFWHGNGEISDHGGEFGRRRVPQHSRPSRTLPSRKIIRRGQSGLWFLFRRAVRLTLSAVPGLKR